MSRSLGANVMRKTAIRATSPEQEGAAAFAAGIPITANPYMRGGHGKGHAWERGWTREATAARRKK